MNLPERLAALFGKNDHPGQEFLDKYKWPIGLGLIGLTLVITGLYAHFSVQEPTRVEIIPAESEQDPAVVWVDIEGAVEKPGVYELPADSRINHLLILAGGLAAEADRDWVEKNVNLAQKLSDGSKLYIPRYQEPEQFAAENNSAGGQVAGSQAGNLININTASASELDTLWGIGEARAKEIIANRPYQAAEELQSKKIIPSNVFERIKDLISVY